ncbi:MAG: hypothetical protein ACXAEU_14455 [Candidatus Hodarchaeales archaeon]|jgi:hypothetical protein
MAKRRIWNDDEISTLVYYWGSKNITFLEKKLNRSEKSITSKASGLGLGSMRKRYIGVAQLVKMTGYGKTQLIKIIRKLGFKVSRLPSRESQSKRQTQTLKYRKARKKIDKIERGREIAFSEEEVSEIIKAINESLTKRYQGEKP